MMTNNFPAQPRYKLATSKAHAVVAEYGLTEFPHNLFDLCKTLGIKTKRYSRIAEKTGLTIEDVSREFKSNRGYIYRSKKGKYFIAYNDTNKKDIIQFTIAHELGHFFMNHLEDFKETELRYLSMDYISVKHKILENEASCFARNLTSPVPIANFFSKDNVLDLSAFFGIGYQAASTRLEFLSIDNYNFNSVKENKTFKQVIGFYSQLLSIYTRLYHCDNCHGEFAADNANFCVFCKNITLWKLPLPSIPIFREFGGEKMIYSKIETNEDNVPIECPNCSAENLDDKYTFCPYCSVIIKNYCLGSHENRYIELDNSGNYEERSLLDQINGACGKSLDGGFRYCPDCGSETSYNRQEFLNSWEIENIGLPF